MNKYFYIIFEWKLIMYEYLYYIGNCSAIQTSIKAYFCNSYIMLKFGIIYGFSKASGMQVVRVYCRAHKHTNRELEPETKKSLLLPYGTNLE